MNWIFMPYFYFQRRHLFYRYSGTGPLLLILRGKTASSASYNGEVRHFSDRFLTVDLDLWGTGQSDRFPLLPEDWWERCAHDAAALARYLNQEKCLVVGSGGGATIALLMAILYPNIVQGVIADSTVECFYKPCNSHIASSCALMSELQIRFWKHAHGNDWFEVLNSDTEFLPQFEKSGGDCFQGRLGQIKCPVLFTANLSDEYLPDVCNQIVGMARKITHSKVIFFNERVHPFMWNRPASFRKIADQFLNEAVERINPIPINQ